MNLRESLTYLQEAYASFTQIGLFIVNHQGEYLTTVTGIDSFTESLFMDEESGLVELIRTITKEDHITKPYVQPLKKEGNRDRLQMIIVPIFAEERIVSYILSSVFQTVQELTHDSLQGETPNAKELTNDQVYHIIEQLQKMATISSSLFEKEMDHRRFTFMRACLSSMNKDDIRITNILEIFLQYKEHMNFILLVQRNRGGQWVVTDKKGDFPGGGNQLNLQTISDLLQESVQGSTSVSIENIQFEPRLSFLYSLQIRPKSLYIFPVKNDLDFKEAIITISDKLEKLPPFCIQTAEMIAEMLALFQSKKQLRNTGYHYLNKISRVVEMSKLMLDLKSIQELMFLILEMSDLLMKSTFASVILKDGTHECLQCEQLSREQITGYIQDIWKQQFHAFDQADTYTKIRSFPFGTMIESPIVIDQQVEAIFCIRTENVTREIEVYTEVLTNLFSIGLARLMKEEVGVGDQSQQLQIPESIIKQLTKRENEILEHMLKGHNNQEIAEILFISAHTVKNHISNIFQKLNITDRRQLFSTIYLLQFYT